MSEEQKQQSKDPAIAAVEERTELVVQEAAELAVSDQATYEAAGKFLTERIKPTLKEIANTFGPMQTKAHEAHKEIVAQRKRHEKPLQDAERLIKGAMGTYHQEQQRIAAEAERKRLAAARKEAEDRAVEEAARLENEGKPDEAASRLEQPVTPVVAPPAPETEAPTAAGVSTRMKPCWRITDASKIDRKFLIPDDKKIGQVVRSMGADAEQLVGGIEYYEEPVVSARAQ